MMPTSFLFAACLALNGVTDQINAGDLAPAFAGLAAIPPETPLALAPAPGVPRIIHVPELQRIAARWSVAAPAGDICVQRPVKPLDAEILLKAMQKALPEGKFEILEFSRRPVPAGDLTFPMAGLRDSPSGWIWNGSIAYDAKHHFPIWARVRVRVPVTRVVALRDLPPGQPIPADAIELQSREQAPDTDARWIRSLDRVVGCWPHVPIRAGAPILAFQLQSPRDVQSGDTVRVTVRNGSAYLETDGRAESSGNIGQAIPVRNLTSQKRFLARVSGKDRVFVGNPSGKENP